MSNNQNSLWGSRAKATVIDDPAVPAPVYDTCEITVIYMQRPISIQDMALGCWFNKAHSLGDQDLEYSTSSLESKRLIVSKGYNRLPLEPLEVFNVKMHVKGDRR